MTGYNMVPVPIGHPCAHGCHWADAKKLVETAQDTLRRARKVNQKMSSVLWCDKGNHPFSAKDKEAEHYSRTVGEETEEFDVCGNCARQPMFQAPKPALGGKVDINSAYGEEVRDVSD